MHFLPSIFIRQCYNADSILAVLDPEALKITIAKMKPFQPSKKKAPPRSLEQLMENLSITAPNVVIHKVWPNKTAKPQIVRSELPPSIVLLASTSSSPCSLLDKVKPWTALFGHLPIVTLMQGQLIPPLLLSLS